MCKFIHNGISKKRLVPLFCASFTGGSTVVDVTNSGPSKSSNLCGALEGEQFAVPDIMGWRVRRSRWLVDKII